MNTIAKELTIRSCISNARPYTIGAITTHIKTLNGNIITCVIPDS